MHLSFNDDSSTEKAGVISTRFFRSVFIYCDQARGLIDVEDSDL
jgi:hypothetical protein